MAESTAVAQSQVVRGLGYPNGREETSPEAVGWQPITEEITTIEKQVSRETSR
jgi:hypothetical protein